MDKFKAEKNADLEFSFPKDLTWEELDAEGKPLPESLKLVDIVIERENDVLLVEIKDPSNGRSPEVARAAYAKKLSDNSLLKHELVPKVRGAYLFLHLLERDNKPFKYVVLLGLDAFDQVMQAGILTGFKERLADNVQNEGLGWKRKYIQECVVLSVEMWNKKFSDWPIERISQRTS